MSLGHYLDAGAFTNLFHKPALNRQAICEGLFAIAKAEARRLLWRCAADKDDAIQEVTLRAIVRLDRYQVKRQRAGHRRTALRYFQVLIRRALGRELLRQCTRREQSLDALFEGSGLRQWLAGADLEDQ